MTRSRAPGVLLLACLGLCLPAWLPAAASESGADAVPAAAAAAATVAPPITQHEARSTTGFVCEHRTVGFAAASASFKAVGKVVLGKQDCYECCQESGLLSDGFESGDTSAWSSTVPLLGKGAQPDPNRPANHDRGDAWTQQQGARREPCESQDPS